MSIHNIWQSAILSSASKVHKYVQQWRPKTCVVTVPEKGSTCIGITST